jgi:hypothetical protein
MGVEETMCDVRCIISDPQLRESYAMSRAFSLAEGRCSKQPKIPFNPLRDPVLAASVGLIAEINIVVLELMTFEMTSSLSPA